MSFTRRIVLVASDHRFSQLVQTHLHKTFLLTAPVVRAEDLPSLVDRDTDGVILYLAADVHDAEKIESSLREMRVQLFPARLAILESDDFSHARRLDALTPHLDARFAWTAQFKEFNTWLRRAVTPGRPFLDPSVESTSEKMRRRLADSTPSLSPLAEVLDIAAAHDVPVLIEGENGTGKTHIARLIHDSSTHLGSRFMTVSCNAWSPALLAQELFGTARTAHEGAKPGKLATVGKGTLLLDEMDTLAPEHQASLLRVLETGEYEPVGGDETLRTEARIIATANSDLLELVEKGKFRRDLYYRLNVVALKLPPLRARPQDVGPLVRGMVARYGAKFGKRIFSIRPEAMNALEQFPWPGNIRQLENVVQQAVLTCAGDALSLAHLPPMVHPRDGGRAVEAVPTAGSLAQNRESTERAAIMRALEKVSYSRTRAAELLGVSRVTLYKKMKKYGLFSQREAAALFTE